MAAVLVAGAIMTGSMAMTLPAMAVDQPSTQTVQEQTATGTDGQKATATVYDLSQYTDSGFAVYVNAAGTVPTSDDAKTPLYKHWGAVKPGTYTITYRQHGTGPKDAGSVGVARYTGSTVKDGKVSLGEFDTGFGAGNPGIQTPGTVNIKDPSAKDGNAADKITVTLNEGDVLTLPGSVDYTFGSVTFTPDVAPTADASFPDVLKDTTLTIDGAEHKLSDQITLTGKPKTVVVDKLPQGYTVDNAHELVKTQPIDGLDKLTEDQQTLVKKLAISYDGTPISQPGQGVVWITPTDANHDVTKYSVTGVTLDELTNAGLKIGVPSLTDKDGKPTVDPSKATTVTVPIQDAKDAAKKVTFTMHYGTVPDDQKGGWQLDDKAYSTSQVKVEIRDGAKKYVYTKILSWTGTPADNNNGNTGNNNTDNNNGDGGSVDKTEDAYTFDVDFSGTLGVYAAKSGQTPAPLTDDRTEVIKPGSYKITYTMDGKNNEGVNGSFYPSSKVSSLDGKIVGEGTVQDADVRDANAKTLKGATEVTLDFHEGAYAFFTTSADSGHLHFQLLKSFDDQPVTNGGKQDAKDEGDKTVTPVKDQTGTPAPQQAKGGKLAQTGVAGGIMLALAATSLAVGVAGRVMNRNN